MVADEDAGQVTWKLWLHGRFTTTSFCEKRSWQIVHSSCCDDVPPLLISHRALLARRADPIVAQVDTSQASRPASASSMRQPPSTTSCAALRIALAWSLDVTASTW